MKYFHWYSHPREHRRQDLPPTLLSRIPTKTYCHVIHWNTWNSWNSWTYWNPLPHPRKPRSRFVRALLRNRSHLRQELAPRSTKESILYWNHITHRNHHHHRSIPLLHRSPALPSSLPQALLSWSLFRLRQHLPHRRILLPRSFPDSLSKKDRHSKNIGYKTCCE